MSEPGGSGLVHITRARAAQHGSPHWAIAALYFSYGGVLGTWASRIATIKLDLGLTTLGLSVALTGLPAGLILSSTVVSRVVRRRTSVTVARAGLPSTCLCLVLPALARSLATLTASLVLLGLCIGFLEVALSVQGVAVERWRGRSVLAGLHGVYSVGVLTMAALGGVLARFHVTPTAHFAGVAALLAGLGLLAARQLRPEPETKTGAVDSADHTRPRLRRSLGYLVGLGMIALCAVLAEGAADDWSGVYLHRNQAASLSLAAFGVAACNGGMALGRFLGDRLIMRAGRRTTLRGAALVAGLGMGLAVVAPDALVAIVGYAVLGIGLATMFPVLLALAGQVDTLPSASAITVVTTAAYFGLFTGPPLVGLTASLTSLKAALAIICGLLLAMLPLDLLIVRWRPAD